MPPIGKIIKVVYSQIAEQNSIILFWLLDTTAMVAGLSRTLGEPAGDNKDT
jgi:hypothetical protein